MKRTRTSFGLVAILACVGLLGLFSACTEKKESAKVSPIVFWHAFSDAARSGWINERVAEWNAKNPSYPVEVANKGSYRETLQAAVLAVRQGDAPHLVQLFEVGSQLAVDSKIFKPVGTIGSFDTSDYIKPVLNYYTIGGEVNSIPFNSSSPILYTNEDMMKKAGLDPKSPPETFGEIITMLEKAKKAGVAEAKLSFNLHSWFFEQWMAEQGAPLVNNSNGRASRATETHLDSEASLKIASWIKKLNDMGMYTYTGKLEDWDGSDAIFTQGQAMFHITSTADLGNIANAAEGKFVLGTGRLPIPDGVTRNGVVIGGASVWVVDGHPEAELVAARDFTLFMTNKENMMSWHKITGYYPVRDSSVKGLTDEGWFTAAPTRTIAFTQLLETIPNDATAGALMGSFLDTRTIIGQALQKILNGASVEASMKEAKLFADQKLTEYNASVK